METRKRKNICSNPQSCSFPPESKRQKSMKYEPVKSQYSIKFYSKLTHFHIVSLYIFIENRNSFDNAHKKKMNAFILKLNICK